MNTTAKTDDFIEAEDAFALLGSMIEKHRPAFRRRCRLAFALVDGGAFFVDTQANPVVERRFTRDADVTVISDQRTVSDLLAGRFDIENPAPDHLFIWGGDEEVWETMTRAFSGTTTGLGARLQSLTGKQR